MNNLDWRERIFLVIAMVGAVAGLYSEFSPKKTPNQYDIPVNSDVLKLNIGNQLPDLTKFNKQNPLTLEQFVELVKSFPEGAFKSNMLFLIAADYNGDSIKLNEILKAYGVLLQAQLKQKDTL